MPDFWDKLFKTEEAAGGPTFAIHGFAALVKLYALGQVTTQEIVATYVDSEGNLMTSAEQQQANIVITAINNATNANPALNVAVKFAVAERVIAAAMLAELGMIDKAEAKALAGV